MKKLLVFGLAIFLVAAFTLPASALENKLGGYMRTRFMTYYNTNGLDDGTGDNRLVDTRTRLYYTALINDNLKFVFKSEHDATWGGTAYGTVGADGQDFQVKNSYIDFNLSKFNFIVGTQGFVFGRGHIFDDDATGVSLIWRGNKNIVPALYWVRYKEGGSGNNNGKDDDIYHAMVVVKTDTLQIVPHVTYWYSNDTGTSGLGTAGDAAKVYYVGADVSMKFKPIDFTLSGIYQGGDYSDTVDVSAYMLNALVSAKFGAFGIHGEAIYGTGDDNTDNTVDAWTPPPGYSYSWSEGYAKGDIDKAGFSAGTTGDKSAQNLMAFNAGLDFSITKTWSAKLDFWNINLAEDDAAGNKDIGNEISLKLKGKVIDGLDLLLIGAYMFSGDAFYTGANEGDPIELAAQLSVSF
ncbi:MAG: hypothetical protein AB1427_16145 [Thermodesulfobacteriota bacterium]